jgi:predicted anti-sigma-YlaC factor YlaD
MACLNAVRLSVVLILLAWMLAGCSPRHLIVQGVVSELVSQGQAPEDDVVLAREASAFYLKLAESLLREAPGNLLLAEAVASGFTQYAYAFVQCEADRIEAKDARAAEKLRQRAANLYRRAQRHAMAALQHHLPGYAETLTRSNPADVVRLRPDQIGTAYWAAASWAAWISLSKDDPNIVADLPQAMRLARQAWEVAPDHGNGALVSLLGTFEVARPGGSQALALTYFDRAIELGAGKNAGIFVAKAEGVALPAGDRVAFESLLRQALVASQIQPGLPNSVMRERAQWLLENVDDLFLPSPP